MVRMKALMARSRVPLALLLFALPVGAQRIVVIIADDVGVDRIGAYREHPRPGGHSFDGRARDIPGSLRNPACS